MSFFCGLTCSRRKTGTTRSVDQNIISIKVLFCHMISYFEKTGQWPMLQFLDTKFHLKKGILFALCGSIRHLSLVQPNTKLTQAKLDEIIKNACKRKLFLSGQCKSLVCALCLTSKAFPAVSVISVLCAINRRKGLLNRQSNPNYNNKQ